VNHVLGVHKLTKEPYTNVDVVMIFVDSICFEAYLLIQCLLMFSPHQKEEQDKKQEDVGMHEAGLSRKRRLRSRTCRCG
jgi:hypothetical protein